MEFKQDGFPKFTYHYKGKSCKPCVVFEIHTAISKRYGAYVLIEKDLRDSLILLDEYQKISTLQNINKILLKGLVKAIVITYGKCFVDADGRRVKLEDSNISAKNKNHHHYLMQMRHQYVAHAGKSQHESCICIYILPPKKEYLKNHDFYPTYRTELYQSITSHNFVKYCRPLIEEVHAFVKDKISELEKKVWEQVTNISPTNYYKCAARNATNRLILNEPIFKLKDI